eukprot:CAMPEP_0196587242 /NCGR_PEP_ID=MMETSP1081-20130531/56858_1 /TAXON_ID=36882 /ORGANISM="Pyramimonas amylifera, Strain CCMP720" /LENGTH=220 /DNA_ID=CAMNT_0041909363 /DNA_START=451 /DNA_END=1113 /DNA_ORIENTATION=-
MLREPAAQAIQEYHAQPIQTRENLLEFVRRRPEIQLATLSRLIDPLLMTRGLEGCENELEGACVAASKELYQGMLHAVDYALNERLSALDVVGIHEMFDQTVVALDLALGRHGELVSHNRLFQVEKRQDAKSAACEGSEITQVMFKSATGYDISLTDLCLYNRHSLFEMLQIRKVSASTVRIYTKWRTVMDQRADHYQQIASGRLYERNSLSARVIGTRD